MTNDETRRTRSFRHSGFGFHWISGFVIRASRRDLRDGSMDFSSSALFRVPDVAPHLRFERINVRELPLLAHPVDQLHRDYPSVQIPVETDQVRLDLPLVLAERRHRADAD